MQSSLMIGGIFLTVGLAVASVGAYCFWSTQNLLEHGVRSPGKVVDMARPGSARSSTPVVQFETADHKVITASGKIASSPPTHKVGDSVTVIYRAASPEDITLDEPLELWFLPGIFGGLGTIFVMVGGGMLIYSIRRNF